MRTNPRKIHLSKITVSKLTRNSLKRIKGGSEEPCGTQQTQEANDPNCNGSERPGNC